MTPSSSSRTSKRHYVGDADKKASILRAVREVATAITSSTITTVAVFLPIAFVGDITGELFRPFALTITIAMAASLLVALTIVPVLAYWFLRPGKPLLDAEGNQIDPEAWDAPPSRLQKGYLPILRWTLRHSWVTLGLAALVLVGTIAISPLMKTNFLGDSGQNTFTVTQDIGAAPSLEAEDAAAQQVEEALLGIEGIETVQVSIGSSGSALRDAFSGGGSGITYSITTDPDADQVQVREDVQAAVADLEDVGTITVAASGGGFGSSDIEIDVTAPDSETLQEATDAVVAAVSDAEGIGQVSSNLSASLPYISVVVDREAAAELGLSEVAVGALVSNTMQPQGIGSVEIDDTTLTVYLAASQTPATIDELRELTVPSATGPIPLSDVAAVEESEGPTSITTEGGQRTATVTATPSTDNLQAATAAVTTALEEADLPAVGRCDARRCRLAAGGRVLAARSGAPRRHPDRLHRHGGDLQVAAPAAAAARLGAVRRDRRDPAADHHGRAARRRLAHRRADADRHRGDQRDRPRRPREPVPHEGADRPRRDPGGRRRDVFARSS